MRCLQGVGGATQINTRASQFAQGSKLAISGTNNPSAEFAVNMLGSLSGCKAHCTAILSDRDEQALSALGIDVTCDPEYQTTNLYSQ